MIRKIKNALIILKFGKAGNSIDFRTLNIEKGLSRSEWEEGMSLLKRFNQVKKIKNKLMVI